MGNVGKMSNRSLLIEFPKKIKKQYKIFPIIMGKLALAG